jgi:hypothetical protein
MTNDSLFDSLLIGDSIIEITAEPKRCHASPSCETRFNLASEDGASAIAFVGSGSTSPYSFTTAIIWGNYIGLSNESVEPVSYGLLLDGIQSLTAENNIIDHITAPTRAIWYTNCLNRQIFNNRSSQGQLYHAYDDTNALYRSELEDTVASDVDDTLMVSEI